jgi:hypothetical protein
MGAVLFLFEVSGICGKLWGKEEGAVAEKWESSLGRFYWSLRTKADERKMSI